MPRFVPIEELFKGRHVNQEIVVLCVRWYLSFKLSFRDWVARLAERGSGMAHTTLLRWVQHYTAEFEELREAIRSPGRRISADGGKLGGSAATMREIWQSALAA